MKKNYFKLALLIICAAALIGGISFFTNKTTSTPVSLSESKAKTISLSIVGVYTNEQVAVLEGDTVLGVLQKLNVKNPDLKVSTKEYSGLGTLVDGMGDYKNGVENKYWQYKVNGVMPQIGADAYQLKDGDTVEWFFASSED